jgi:hypothetical protein
MPIKEESLSRVNWEEGQLFTSIYLFGPRLKIQT